MKKIFLFIVAIGLTSLFVWYCKNSSNSSGKKFTGKETRNLKILEKDSSLRKCVDDINTLSVDGLTDSMSLIKKINKALDIEYRLYQCYNTHHGKSGLSLIEEADSMINEAYVVFDTLAESPVTTDMREYIHRRFYLMRYKELLCYRNLGKHSPHYIWSQSDRMLLDEALAWQSFSEAYNDLAIQCVKMDFITGGTMALIVAPNCVLQTQECRYNSLRNLMWGEQYEDIKTDEDNPDKDYETVFIKHVTMRIDSLYDPSALEYIPDKADRKSYKKECTLVKKKMLPIVIDRLNSWISKRTVLDRHIYGEHCDTDNRICADISDALKTLEKVIEPSY